MNNVKPTIFVDYDGVLVNFRQGVLSFIGKDWDDHTSKEEKDARNVATFGNPTFWPSLPPMNDFYHLWNYILPFEPHILTAYPYDMNRPAGIDVIKLAQDGKWEWNEIHTRVPSERFHCVDRADKANYATKVVDGRVTFNILIDDTIGNVKEWIANRGIGILHINAKETLEKLRQLRELNLL